MNIKCCMDIPVDMTPVHMILLAHDFIDSNDWLIIAIKLWRDGEKKKKKHIKIKIKKYKKN